MKLPKRRSVQDDIDRGFQAKALVENEMFIEALIACRDWAMRDFRAATTERAAWEARLKLEAADAFSAHLRAVISLGRSQTEALNKRQEAKFRVAS